MNDNDEYRSKGYAKRLNDDGFITSIQDLILSKETFITFYVEIMKENKLWKSNSWKYLLFRRCSIGEEMDYLYKWYYYLLILVVIILFTYTLKSKNNNNETEKLKLYLKEEYNNLKIEMLKLVNESSQFSQTELFKTINNQFETITNKVNTNINESFKKTDRTFVNVVERLTKIDEQNKNINKLSNEVLKLNNILTDKSSRGTFWEVQLNKLLESVLGKNKQLYETQKTLSNNKIVDAVIYAPKPLGMIAVDSKFTGKLSKDDWPQLTKEKKNTKNYLVVI